MKLPMADRVPFNAYQTRGFEAGILLANYENAEEFLFNSCINFFVRWKKNKLTSEDTRDKTSCLTDHGVFNRPIHPINLKDETREDIIDRIVRWIDNGVYVYGVFNEMYIPHKKAYGVQNFNHGYLIYGYDNAEKIFFAIGYTDNQKFEKYTIAYDDYFNSIEHIDNPSFSSKYLDRNREYKFDLYKMYWELQDYLRSEYTVNNQQNKQPDEIYGVDANWVFQRYVLNIKKYCGYLDPRHSRLFFENKEFMLKRLQYIHQNGFVNDYTEQYSSIVEESKKVHLHFLKYKLKPDEKTLHSISDMLIRINNADFSILSEVFDELTCYLQKKRAEMYI